MICRDAANDVSVAVEQGDEDAGDAACSIADDSADGRDDESILQEIPRQEVCAGESHGDAVVAIGSPVGVRIAAGSERIDCDDEVVGIGQEWEAVFAMHAGDCGGDSLVELGHSVSVYVAEKYDGDIRNRSIERVERVVVRSGVFVDYAADFVQCGERDCVQEIASEHIGTCDGRSDEIGAAAVHIAAAGDADWICLRRSVGAVGEIGKRVASICLSRNHRDDVACQIAQSDEHTGNRVCAIGHGSADAAEHDAVVEEVAASHVRSCERHGDEVVAVCSAIRVRVVDCAGRVRFHEQVFSIGQAGEAVAAIGCGGDFRNQFGAFGDAVAVDVEVKPDSDSGDWRVERIDDVVVCDAVFKDAAADGVKCVRGKSVHEIAIHGIGSGDAHIQHVRAAADGACGICFRHGVVSVRQIGEAVATIGLRHRSIDDVARCIAQRDDHAGNRVRSIGHDTADAAQHDAIIQEVAFDHVGSRERDSDQVVGIGGTVRVGVVDCAGRVRLHDEICALGQSAEAVAAVCIRRCFGN